MQIYENSGPVYRRKNSEKIVKNFCKKKSPEVIKTSRDRLANQLAANEKLVLVEPFRLLRNN